MHARSVASAMSDSVQSYRWQPNRLPRPWDSPGKNTGVGCHFLLQCMRVKVKVKSLSRVRLFETPWTAAHQAPPCMGFSRQEYWSGVPWPSPRHFLYHTIKHPPRNQKLQELLLNHFVPSIMVDHICRMWGMKTPCG